jgi:nucleoside-diphosphate-sugar epimerase
MIRGKRIVITGGAGFIGTSLTRALKDDNKVVIYDSFHRDALQSSDLAGHPGIEIIRGDVLDRDHLFRVVEGADIVVHMASIAGVDTVMRNPVKTMRVSLLGTINALDAAHETAAVSRFVDFSTSEVFGKYAYKVTEGDTAQLGAVGEARWTYAVSKLATEHLALNYHKEFGLPALSIRPFNIYGPGQVGEGAIHHFIVKALKGEPLTVHNDGSQIRSWCYVEDIIAGILLALEKDSAVGHAFNIGNPRATVTIYNLAALVVRLAGSASPVRSIRWDFPDVELRIPNINKARELLGFEPAIDLDEGLQRTIEWYRRQLGRGGAKQP